MRLSAVIHVPGYSPRNQGRQKGGSEDPPRLLVPRLLCPALPWLTAAFTDAGLTPSFPAASRISFRSVAGSQLGPHFSPVWP